MILRPLRRLVFAALLAVPYWAEETTLTPQERQQAVARLTESRDKLLTSVRGLTPDQLTFHPAPGAWSIAEIAEHLILTESGIPQLIQNQILKSPRIEHPAPRPDAAISRVLTNRTGKAKAPEPLQPTGRFRDAAVIQRVFTRQRAAAIQLVEQSQDDLRHHQSPHSALGPLDAYQWILFLAGHTERHILQIEEVKRSPDFPRAVD